MIKSKSPFVTLLSGLLFLGVLVIGVMTYIERLGIDQKKEVFLDIGKSYLSDAVLAPFKDKWSGNLMISDLEESVGMVMGVVEDVDRAAIGGYLVHQVRWDTLYRSPYHYIGAVMPTYSMGYKMVKENAIRDEANWSWVDLNVNERVVRVLVAGETPYVSEREKIYLDVFYLGEVEFADGVRRHMGVSSQMYILPNGGMFPEMKTDEIAMREVVDDRSMTKETRRVSSLAFFHYLAKIQKGLDKKDPIQSGVGYGELMESPDRYRGKMVEFKGTVIHFERRKLPGKFIVPGMDFYYQLYILNIDQIPYVVRTTELPEKMKLKDVLHVKGYFLQRFNFINRHERVTWVPLLITGDISIMDTSIQMMDVDKQIYYALAIVSALMILGYFAFRFNRPSKPRRLKKEFKPVVSESKKE